MFDPRFTLLKSSEFSSDLNLLNENLKPLRQQFEEWQDMNCN